MKIKMTDKIDVPKFRKLKTKEKTPVIDNKYSCVLCVKLFNLNEIYRIFSDQLHENVWVCKNCIKKVN